MLINVDQSISCMFLTKFSAVSRKLLKTIVFTKLSSYDMIIPGNDSKISWKVPISLPNTQTKFKHYSCSGTVLILTNRWRHVTWPRGLNFLTPIFFLIFPTQRTSFCKKNAINMHVHTKNTATPTRYKDVWHIHWRDPSEKVICCYTNSLIHSFFHG